MYFGETPDSYKNDRLSASNYDPIRMEFRGVDNDGVPFRIPVSQPPVFTGAEKEIADEHAQWLADLRAGRTPKPQKLRF